MAHAPKLPKSSPATGRKRRRLYVPQAWQQSIGAIIPLTPDQKRHLITALRHGAGDEVTWFDGGAATGLGVLRGSERTGFGVELVTTESVPLPPLPASVLALAIPKRETLPLCVELATIAGISTIELFCADHSPWKVREEQVPALIQKLTVVGIEASEQCGRQTVPGICWDERGHAQYGVIGTVACTLEELGRLSRPSAVPDSNRTMHLAIAPEGGWSVRELDAFEAAGWTPWHIPGATLTTVAACAILPALWRYGNYG